MCVCGIAPFSTFTDRFHLFSAPPTCRPSSTMRAIVDGCLLEGCHQRESLVGWGCWSCGHAGRVYLGSSQARTVRIIVRPRANPGKGPRQGLEALPWRYIFVVPVTEVALSRKPPPFLWIISSDASLDTPRFLDFYLLLVFLSLVGR